jgi:histidyl-tRNA synthetase
MESGNTISSAPPSGMRDILPKEAMLREWATNTIISTYQKFGFTRIETPALENINLLRRGEGGENLQLIFEVLKRGDKLERELASGKVTKQDLADLGLRFDLTVPLVRFYSSNIANLPNPFKAIQVGSVWRAESPQAGRFRQFTQCDIDMFGVKSELAEIELLQATSEALLALGFEGFTIRINDRRVLAGIAECCGFESAQHNKVFIALDKLDKIGLAGVKKELENDGHPSSSVSQLCGIFESIPQPNSPEVFNKLTSLLASIQGVDDAITSLKKVIDVIASQSDGRYSITFDPSLVRGMGYYTGQIFEISAPGYSSSIAGGGRYDKMVGKFSGRDVPACGFSIGFERIISILTEKGHTIPETYKKKIALIVDPDQDNLKEALTWATSQRKQGFMISIQPRKKDMRKHLDALSAQGFSHFSIFKNDSEPEIKELGNS